MRTERCPRAWLGVVLALVLASAAPALAAEQGEIEQLKQEIETLRRRDAERARQIEELRLELERLRTPAGTAPSTAAPPAAAQPAAASPAAIPPAAAPAAASAGPPETGGPSALDRAVAALEPAEPAEPAAAGDGAIFARRIGPANLKLLDIGMGVLWAAGGSSASDPEIEGLQQGAHDPRRRGFTLQQAELSLAGAVDPYFRGDAFIIATPGEVELEEAFLTSTALPFGLQLEAGTFFTEFGVVNAQHPHQWNWIDQPVVNSRLFGGEGLRGPGFRLGWLTPLPWFSEIHVGAQNPNEGERTASFIGEEPVGGRPQVKTDVDGLGDLLYLARWVNSWDPSDSLTGKIGVSGLFGPNDTGNDGRTYLYGADVLWKWQPPTSFRGWPFVTWQTEVMKRDYRADRFAAGTAVEGGDDEDAHGHAVTTARDRQDDDDHDDDGEDDLDEDLAGAILRDWGLYTQVLWGIRHPWALGIRYEYASGSGASLPDGRNQDSLRDDRHRLSPLVLWQPTEFTRFRLQYNYDRARFLEDDEAHSVWFAMEVLYGAHMAHTY